MKYKIYIPSKGRYDNTLTADYLRDNNVDFSLVVEKNEADLYRKRYPNNVIELPGNDYGGVYFARNFIKALSITNGEKRHWQIDDDIKRFAYVKDKKLFYMSPNQMLGNMENFCDRFTNVGLAAPHSTVWVRFGKKPFDTNKLAYGCLLVNNIIGAQWNNDVMEDIDYNLQVLEKGWCTVRFYTYSFGMSPRTSQKGGVTEYYLDKEERFNTVKNTQEKWGLGKITKKTVSGNIIYTVQFANKFREYNQKLIADFDGKYLKAAREVTQNYIETCGADWKWIDMLDMMIAKAIEEEVKNWLEELYVQ